MTGKDFSYETCAVCNLQAVQNCLCTFCGHQQQKHNVCSDTVFHVDRSKLEPSSATLQQSASLNSAVPERNLTSSAAHPAHHADRAQDGPHLQAPGLGRRRANCLEHSADQGPIGRAEDFPEGRTPCSPEEPIDRAQPCSSEEGNSRRLCPGLGDPGASQRHHQCALCQVRREDHGGDAADGQRPGELRQALRQEVQGDPGGMSLLCRVDPNHSRREPRVVVAPEEQHITQFKKTEKDLPPSGYHPRHAKGNPSGSSTDLSDGSFLKIQTDDSDSELESLEDRTGPAPLREQHDGSANVAQQVPQGDLSVLDDFEDNSEWEDCPEHQCFQAHSKIGQKLVAWNPETPMANHGKN